MATTRRDIELLISAKETTGRSFRQVTSNIDALNSKIGDQIAAAERGEASLRDLKNTQEQLAQAGRDLSSIQSQIDAYNRLVASSEKVGGAYEKAKADLAAFKATLEGSGEATKAQENKLQRLENAVTRTSAAVEKNKVDLTEQVAALDRAGVSTKNLDGAQAAVVNTARQIGAGLTQVNAAIDGYSSNVEQARIAESNLAQQQGFERKISEAERLGQASRFVQLFADAIQTIKVADNQLAALTGFRAVGQQATEAANDISRFVQSGQTMAVSTQQVAAGLRAIIDPGQAALKTIDGLEATIEKADAAAAEGVKNVGALNDAYNLLSASSAALLNQGGLIDTFRQQAVATETARAQFQQAQGDVQRLGAAMAAADQPTEALANSLKQAESRLEQTGRALSQEETKLGKVSRELKSAGINTADLANEQLRLEAAAQRVNGTMERVNTTLGRGGRRTTGLFGLKPNDLANLNFQIQDIVVSLQAGQAPLTVLFQQGSQISQIFPGLISTIARFVVAWFPLIAVLGVVAAVIGRAIQESNRLEDAQKNLIRTVNGADYKAEDVVAFGKSMEELGHAYEDATAAAQAFIKEGLPTDEVDKYAEAALNLAQRLGIDVAEASQLVADINVGGLAQLDELQSKTGDLTDAEYEHAKALFEAGKAAEARQYILDIVASRNAEIAQLTESKWIPAVNGLRNAFSRLADFLASVLTGRLSTLQKELDNLAVGAAYVFSLLSGEGFDGARAAARRSFDSIQNARNATTPAGGSTPQQVRDQQFRAELDDEVEASRTLTNAERLRRAEVEARTRAQEAGVSKALEDRAVTQAIAKEQRDINKEAERASKKGAAAGRRADAAARRAERAAATAQRARETAQRSLEGQLRQLNRAAFAGVSATLEERLSAIDEKYESIADSIAKVRSLGLTTDSDGTSLVDIEKQVEATKERLRSEERIKFFQEQAALLDKQRSAELQRITDAQERGALTTQGAMEAAAEVVGRLSPQIVRAAEQALSVARALAGANPSPEMVSWIASLERIITGEGINRNVADIGLAGLDEASGRLDTLLQERDQLVQSYQTLFELGLKSEAEVRELTAEAYSRQAASIEPVLAQLREQVELLHNTIDPLTGLPVITDTAYAAWLAKLDAVNAGLANIDPRLTQINSAVRQSIQNGVVTAFNAAADAIVGLIGGTQSFGDAIENLGRTALSIFGSMLDAIAQVLVQMAALQVAQSVLGVGSGGLGFLFHDGGVVGRQGGSRQRRTGGMGSWIGAPKFHGGGGLGLRPDEYKAVLQRGEEVLTEDDPRHVRNLGKGGGSGGGGGQNLKQVLLLDPAAVPNAMQSRSGQKSILTVIRQNAETIKLVLK